MELFFTMRKVGHKHVGKKISLIKIDKEQK